MSSLCSKFLVDFELPGYLICLFNLNQLTSFTLLQQNQKLSIDESEVDEIEKVFQFCANTIRLLNLNLLTCFTLLQQNHKVSIDEKLNRQVEASMRERKVF